MELTACSPDGRMLAAMGDKHESIDIWDVATGNQLGTFGGILAGDRELGWMSFSRDGGSLFAVGNTGFVSCGVALKDGALSLGWTNTTKLPLKCECGGAGDTSPDGKEIAVRATGAAFLVFPIAEPSKARTATVGSGRIVGLSWSRDGGRIAVSNSQTAPVIFDAKSLAQLRTFGNGSGRLTFSPDGRFLALTTATACEILDATSYQLVKSFERHPLEGNPGEIVFAQNGTFLVLSTEGRKTELIDLTRMENVATFEPPASSRANRLDLLPDGSSLILHDADSAYIYRLLPLRRELAAMGLDW